MKTLEKYFAGGFEQRQKPSLFLTNLCKKKLIYQGVVEFDRRKVKSLYSVNVPQCRGGRAHDLTAYETVEFKIPKYNDYSRLDEDFLEEKSFGETPYVYKQAKLINKITHDQGIFSDFQRRAQEKQVADGLLNGKIVLIDKSEIAFNKLDKQDISATKKWSDDTSKPLDDMNAAAQVVVDEGKVGTSSFNWILNGADIDAFLGNSQVQKNAKKLEGIDRVAIGMPEEITLGAALHGFISAGGFKHYIWSYNGTYDIPTGFKFAYEGTSVSFIPKGRSICLPAGVDLGFKMYYGGLVKPSLGADAINYEKLLVEQLPWAYTKTEAGTTSFEYGVKSKPLFVPENPHGYATLRGI